MATVDLVSIGETWAGIVDDAAIFPPGNVPLEPALTEHLARTGVWYADLVGPFVVNDVRLPELLEVIAGLDEPEEDGVAVEMAAPLRASVVVTGGAGAIRPAATWATRSGQLRLSALETVLRDPDDLATTARRVAAAIDECRSEGVLADNARVHVELPHEAAGRAGWMAAADIVAEEGFRLKFRTGGADASMFPAPHALASWISAALDREVPFKCTAGLHEAVRHDDPETGFAHHGFLNVLLATRASLDGASIPEVAELLDTRDREALAARAHELGDALRRTRNWFTSFGCCSVLEPLEDLVDLGLVAPPRDADEASRP
jgi:hypothetical protein